MKKFNFITFAVGSLVSLNLYAALDLNNSRFLVFHPHACWDRNDMREPFLPTNDAEPYQMARSVSETLSCKGEYGCSTIRNKVAFGVEINILQFTAEQIEYKVKEAFRGAREYNIPTFFHVNYEWMFRGPVCFGPWMREGLSESYTLPNGQPRANFVEHKSWDTPSSEYVVNWGAPVWMPPRPNFSSPEFRADIKSKTDNFLRLVKFYSQEIPGGVNGDLFLGIDVGWETGITNDNANTMNPPKPQQPQGYGALKSRGFSAQNPPGDFEEEVGKAVLDFVQYEVSMYKGVIPKEKIFTHFLSLKTTDHLYKRHPLHLLPEVKDVVYGISAGWGDNVGLDQFNHSVLQPTGNPDWAVTEAPPEVGMKYFEGVGIGSVKPPKTVVIYSWSAGNVTNDIVERVKKSITRVMSPDAGRIIGTIDGLNTANNTISGWACGFEVDAPIKIHLYVGGPAGQGKMAGEFTANGASEVAVANACSAYGSNYRFGIPLSAAFINEHQGKSLYIHGISPTGQANLTIRGSGNFKVPASNTPAPVPTPIPTPPTTPTDPEAGIVLGNIDGVTSAGVIGGWACGKKLVAPIKVQVYLGGASGTGTYVGEFTAGEGSETAVGKACASNGPAHRFGIALSSELMNLHKGKAIFIHGVSPTGKGNNQISGSGKFVVPTTASIPNPNVPTVPPASVGDTGKIVGHIDGVGAANGSYFVGGWACGKAVVASIKIHLYIGGSAGVGKFAGEFTANGQSEEAVAKACSSTGSAYRFGIPFDAAFLAKYKGQAIHIHGISPTGKTNEQLGNTGKFKVP